MKTREVTIHSKRRGQAAGGMQIVITGFADPSDTEKKIKAWVDWEMGMIHVLDKPCDRGLLARRIDIDAPAGSVFETSVEKPNAINHKMVEVEGAPDYWIGALTPFIEYNIRLNKMAKNICPTCGRPREEAA